MKSIAPVVLLSAVFLLSIARMGSAAVFSTNTDLAAAETGFDGQEIVIDGATVTVNGQHTFLSLLMTNGAILTHSIGPTGGVNLTITGDVFLCTNCQITVSGLGYGASSGPGRGGTSPHGEGGGGGHGGYGGPVEAPASSAPYYGSLTEPVDWGSGGANGGGQGGAGGGAIKLVVGGRLILDGALTANGNDGLNSQAGGGAGGSIWIRTDIIAGGGLIAANGGNGASGYSGGGGGGRIAIYYRTNNFTGTISAMGGASAFTPFPIHGGPGTIFTKSATQAWGDLVLNNGDRLSYSGELGTQTLDNLTLRGGTILPVAEDAVLTLLASVLSLGTNSELKLKGQMHGSNLTIAGGGMFTLESGSSLVCTQLAVSSAGILALAGGSIIANSIEVLAGGNVLVNIQTTLPSLCVRSNGVVTHATGATNLALTLPGDLTVDSGGTITGSGLGFRSDEGPGRGGFINQGAAAGAGYGGNGGGSSYSPAFGTNYGSQIEPAEWGSGGGGAGFFAGGAGGGAMRLVVGGVLALQGTIRSDGDPGKSGTHEDAGGGGSGGSVSLTVGTLAGSGIISANGGDGGTNSRGIFAGGGGGGRMAVRYDHFAFSGLVTATGGSGYQPGQRGTIYTPPGLKSLSLGKQTPGFLEASFSEDDWHFTGVAGQQISLKQASASAFGVAFDLIGPGGWIGFSDVTNESPLTNLLVSGEYTLKARGVGVAHGINYTFRLQETGETNLQPGMLFRGTLIGDGQAQLFSIAVPPGQAMRITLTSPSSGNQVELYSSFGARTTRGMFDYRAAPAAGNQQILVPIAYAGKWYVLVYGDTVATPREYTLLVETAELFVTKVTPERLGNSMPGSVTIEGAGFGPSNQVELVSGAATFSASNVTYFSQTRLGAEFDFTVVPPGMYQLRVSSGTNSAALPFEILFGGEAALHTRLIVPSQIGRRANATLYVEYANTGHVAMAAPLLLLKGSDKAQMTLAPIDVVPGFWTSATPRNFSDVIQILGSGRTPGVLQPGERFSIPVYFIGLAQPWDLSVDSVRFDWGVARVDGPSSGLDDMIDWNSLKSSMRPGEIGSDAWEPIWDNFVAQAGGTWRDYVRMLNQNANYLWRLGRNVTDVNPLLAFSFAQANGLNVIRYLAASTDASASAPGVRLAFERIFPQRITERYKLGALGRGWSHNWDMSIHKHPDGRVTVTGPAGATLDFQPDSRGGYFPPPGEHASLSFDGLRFILRYPSGRLVAFGPIALVNVDCVFPGTPQCENGPHLFAKLEYVQDLHGNTVSALWSGNQLLRLTHSAGQSLEFTYDGDRLATITDPVGRQTAFTYAGEHLSAVRYYDGSVVRYKYEGAAAHALTEIEYPGGNHEYFTYSASGRLTAMSRDGGAEVIGFGYDSPGTLSATDALGHTTKFYLDDRGLLAKVENPLGQTLRMQYDEQFNLTGITDPAGRSQAYHYDSTGNLIQSIDANGGSTRFTYSSQFNRMLSLTDANGNSTRYTHDAQGDLRAITYADSNVERWAYDNLGNPITWTNRRGQPLVYQYNTNGQLTAKLYPDGSAARYDYDPRGNLISGTNTAGPITLAYDASNRLQRIAYPGNRWLEYEYDSAGRRVSMTDQLGYRLGYRYDNVGRLESMTNSAGTEIVRYQYDPVGRLARKVLGNGVYTTYGYDPAGQLLSLTNRRPNDSVLSFFNYTYDNRGRRTAMATHYGAWTYEYDDLGQLTHAVLASTDGQIPNQDLLYIYDPMGNRVRTIENGVTTEYVVNNMNQYLRVGNRTNTFDADGNLVREAAPNGTNSYTYHNQTRLAAVMSSEWMAEYTSDALNNRVARTANGVTTHYVIDPVGEGNLVAEYDEADDLIAHYNHGLGLLSGSDIDGNLTSYSFDALGNAQQLLQPNGVVVHYAYAPFGTLLQHGETNQNSFRFVGQSGVSSEENGLICMRARDYNPTTGRFITQDPIGLNGGVNLYAYVNNRPTMEIDPSGLVAIVFGLAAIVNPKHGVPNFYDHHRDPEPPGDPFYDGEENRRRNEETFRQFIERDKSHEGGASDDRDRHPPPGGLDGYRYYTAELMKALVRDRPPRPISEDPFHNGGIEPPTESDQRVSVPISRPRDPNDKIGPSGYDLQRFVAIGNPLSYDIRFENDPSSSAPAQMVEITDPLSSDLDWASFELTELAFGDTMISVAPGAQHFETNVPVRFNGVEFEVQIEAGLRLASGEVYAVFRSVVPASGLPPGVETGFLPPNIREADRSGAGRGEGHFGYSVRAKPGLATGTQIRNVARITFDRLETIATNQRDPHNPGAGTDTNKEAFNTIDSGAPSSSVTPLPDESGRAFVVQWSAQDDAGGSGVASYDIFVSTNGGPFVNWVKGANATAATFTGEPGRSYEFYCIARDNVGNQQSIPVSAQAHTLVVTNAPMLRVVTNQLAGVGTSLVISNMVDGAAAGSFVYSLGPRAPFGASINPSNGIFRWTPTCAQGSTTNRVTIWATDSGRTNISDAVTFTVIVRECVQAQAGQLVLRTGETGRLPINLISSAQLSNVSMTLGVPASRLTKLAAEAVAPEICTNPTLTAALFHSMGGGVQDYRLGVATCSNQWLIGTQQVAWLYVTAAPNQSSAFVPVSVGDLLGSQPDGTVVSNLLAQAGRVVVVGAEPLLEALHATNRQIQLVVYAPPGTTNRVESASQFGNAGNWTLWQEIVATNLIQALPFVSPTNEIRFFRALRK